jgi:hypothetical protein
MKSGLRFATTCALIFGAMATAQIVKGDTLIPIDNSSFEITNLLTMGCGDGCAYNNGPIPGWTVAGGQTGTWMPNSTYFNSPVPDGSLVAFSNGSTISQTLTGFSLNPNSTYILSVFVGNRLDGLNSDYSFSLGAGSTILATFSGSGAAIPAGTFQQESLTYTTGDTVTAGDLTILLTSAGPQTDFDNVSLVDPPADNAVPTPEPGSVWMLGAGLLSLLGLAVPRSLKA